jgi:hypothetical protein
MFRNGWRGEKLVQFGFAVAVLGVGEKLVERGAVQILSAQPEGLGLRCVVLLRSVRGSAESKTRSARLPGAREPAVIDLREPQHD